MSDREEGVANLATESDYNHLAERVNANHFDQDNCNLLTYNQFLLITDFNYQKVKFCLAYLLPATVCKPLGR